MALSEASKERIKLRSTFLNNIAVGVMLLGTISTVIALVTGNQHATGNLALSVALVCIALSLGIHVVAVRWLEELDK